MISRYKSCKRISKIATALVLLLGTNVAYVAIAQTENQTLMEFIETTEASLDARIGVTVTVLDSDESWEYNADDRFPMSSTFKTIACAALLHRVDQGLDRLDRVVHFTEEDLVSYSPVTETRVGTAGMTLFEICEATITISDNTAGNLVLDAIGGPPGFTDFARSIGDDITQLNRWETDLNEAVPGDLRDTTTPNAMAALMEELLFGEILSLDSRRQLETWLKGNAVGDALLRAGIPDDWEIGDKTGAGGFGSRSIAAILWPPSGSPVVSTIYITETDASFEDRDLAIAEIGRAIALAVSN